MEVFSMEKLKATMKTKQHNDNGTLHGFAATIAAILAVVFLICKAVPVLALDEGAADIPGPINERILTDECDTTSEDATGKYAFVEGGDSILLQLPVIGDLFYVDRFGDLQLRPFDDSAYEELMGQIAADDGTSSNSYYGSDYYFMRTEQTLDNLEIMLATQHSYIYDLRSESRTQEQQIAKLEQTVHDTTRNFMIALAILVVCAGIYICYTQCRICRLKAEIESWEYEDEEDDENDATDDTNAANEAGNNLNE